MISRIEGKLILKTEKIAVIDVSGVGYKINIGIDTFSHLKDKEGQNLAFWTHLAVKEDSMELYGFEDREQLQFFEMLLNVSGIGPKSAISIIGIGSIESLKKAIGSGDASYLNKVSGIGKKIAEKIIFELKDKLNTYGYESGQKAELQSESDAVEVLRSLGYGMSEARDALKKVSPEIEGISAKIKEALKILSG
ncbi:MAG: Holliday junction branch migration protein RuvA [Candidatus Paceibacterota bacterium]|jgi:Holliday junction DNA helicase RuvA